MCASRPPWWNATTGRVWRTDMRSVRGETKNKSNRGVVVTVYVTRSVVAGHRGVGVANDSLGHIRKGGDGLAERRAVDLCVVLGDGGRLVAQQRHGDAVGDAMVPQVAGGAVAQAVE